MNKESLYLAALLLILSIAFRFEVTEESSRICWIWKDHLHIPLIMITASFLLILRMLVEKKEIKG